MTKEKDTTICTNSSKRLITWDSAINDAKAQIEEAKARIKKLRRAIKTLEFLRDKGAVFPSALPKNESSCPKIEGEDEIFRQSPKWQLNIQSDTLLSTSCLFFNYSIKREEIQFYAEKWLPGIHFGGAGGYFMGRGV